MFIFNVETNQVSVVYDNKAKLWGKNEFNTIFNKNYSEMFVLNFEEPRGLYAVIPDGNKGNSYSSPSEHPELQWVKDNKEILIHEAEKEFYKNKNYTYNETTKVWEKTLDDLKADKKQEIIRSYAAELLKGYAFTFNGNSYTLQTRNADDKINWLSVLLEAKELVASGYNTQTITIRTLENENIDIPAEDIIPVLEGATANIKTILQKAWTLKDSIKNASTVTELNNIQW